MRCFLRASFMGLFWGIVFGALSELVSSNKNSSVLMWRHELCNRFFRGQGAVYGGGGFTARCCFLLLLGTYERKQLLVCHTSWYGTTWHPVAEEASSYGQTSRGLIPIAQTAEHMPESWDKCVYQMHKCDPVMYTQQQNKVVVSSTCCFCNTWCAREQQ